MIGSLFVNAIGECIYIYIYIYTYARTRHKLVDFLSERFYFDAFALPILEPLLHVSFERLGVSWGAKLE